MKTKFRFATLLVLIALSVGFLQACKNKNPSTIKIFVRSASNELVEGAKVVIIGDPSSNPATMEYVDTVITNGSGFATFNMDAYYDAAGEDSEIGYFDVIVKTATKQASGRIRSRVHTTAVETIFLPL
jgi:hypothetical protein